MDVRLVHPSKVLVSILDRFSGIVMDVKLVHPLKASIPISDTFSGIVMDVKLVQPLYMAAVDYQQLADNTVEKSCVFDTRD